MVCAILSVPLLLQLLLPRTTGAERVTIGRTFPRSGNATSAFLHTSTRQSSAFVANPRPQTYADFAPGQGQRLQAPDFFKLQLKLPGESPELSLFGYPISQDNIISATVAMKGSWEADKVTRILGAFQQTPSEGLNFLDLGGNIGTFTLPLAAYLAGRGGRVFSVEAMPSIAEHLKAGIVANSLRNVDLYSYAVAGPVKSNSLVMALQPENKGGSAVLGNKPETYNERTEHAPLTTLDAMLGSEPGLRRVLVAKIDIEGNEGRALRGAARLLREAPPCYLAIELNSGFLADAGSSVEEVAAVLSGAGYDVSQVHQGEETYWLEQSDVGKCLARLAAGGEHAASVKRRK